MIKRLSYTIVALILALTASVGVAIPSVMFAEPTVVEKKAIVIVTALLSGALVDSQTGASLWDPLPIEDICLDDFLDMGKDENADAEVIGKIFSSLIDDATWLDEALEGENSILNRLILNEDGTSKPNVVAATMASEGRIKYGVLNCYYELYTALQARYGEEYEVTVFNYDWRLDNRYNAILLEEYINGNGYTDVILTAHSMGGNVVSNYLARSKENRDKITAFCSFGTPYFGSMEALAILENPNSALGGFGLADLGLEFLNIDVEALTEQYLTPMLTSWTSLYQLLPSIELASTAQYSDGQYMLSVNGEPITDLDALIDFYLSRPFAKNADGTTRKAMSELKDYYLSSYVDVNGEKVHSTSLVDTYYFVGLGLYSTESASYTVTDTSTRIRYSFSFEGDSIVPLYSATCDNDPMSDNTYIYQAQHIVLGTHFTEFFSEGLCAVIDGYSQK